MRKILIIIALLILPSAAFAQCNGIFAANTVCGNPSGIPSTPKPVAPTTFQGAAGGTNGQIQYNNSGTLGGFTMGGDCTVAIPNITCLKTNGIAFGQFATDTPTQATAGLNLFTSSLQGLVPSSGGVSTNILYGNATWGPSSNSSNAGWTGPSVCNLEVMMNTTYGVGGWSHYTGVGTGTDIGPALTACKTQFAASSGIGTIFVPSDGEWMLKSQGLDFSGISIIGNNSLSTIIFNPTSPPGSAFTWSGAGGLTGGGMQNIALLLDSGLGTTGNNALIFQGNSTFQPDESQLSHLYITSVGGTSTWNTCLLYNGVSRTTPQGVRVATVNDVQLFECNTVGAQFTNIVQFSINNLGIYVSSGTGQDFVLAGGGSTLTNSVQVVADNIITSQNIRVTNSSRIFLRGYSSTNIIVDTTTTHSLMWVQSVLSGTCGTSCTVTTF